MKKKQLVTLAAILLCSTVNRQISILQAQGSLTPPGAPAPTMKTLAQIEPRTPISSLPFTISDSGSYYLATNLIAASGQSGVTISSGDVTLDLNGFALQGTSSFEHAISIPGAVTNVIVRNGTISGWGGYGVSSPSSSSISQVFERLNISSCDNGIVITGRAFVNDCYTGFNRFSGIYFYNFGVVSRCESDNNGTLGVGVASGTVSGCTTENNSDDGVDAITGIVTGCRAVNNGTGIVVTAASVLGCTAENNVTEGIYVTGSGSLVSGNTCGNNGTGIEVAGSGNRVEDNHVLTTSSHVGINILGAATNNIIVKNSVIGDGSGNYSLSAGNDVGPIGAATNSTSPWANFSH